MRPFNAKDLERLERVNNAAIANPEGFNMRAVLCWARMFATFREAVRERNDMKTALAAQCMKTISVETELVDARRMVAKYYATIRKQDGWLAARGRRAGAVSAVLSKHIPNEEKIKTLQGIVNRRD